VAAVILRRLLAALLAVVMVSALTFLVLHWLRPDAFPPDDRPLAVELGRFLFDAFVRFEFGGSFVGNRTVAELIGEGLPADLSLLLVAVPLGVVAGMAGGAVCATRPGTLASRVLEGLAAFFLIAPVFWLGLMATLLFSPQIDAPLELFFFPAPQSYVPLTSDPLAWLHAMSVPWLVMGAPIAALSLRMTRSALVEVLREPYVQTAHAKGLKPGTVLRRHALPPAAAPVLSLVSVYMSLIIGNAVLVELVFSLPGVLSRTARAAAIGDFALLQGLVVVSSALIVLCTTTADVVQARLDPRTRR